METCFLFIKLLHLFFLIVFDNFKIFFSEEIEELWKKGIEYDSYFLKLCGSGGGGYILGFAKDIEKAKKELIGHKEHKWRHKKH